MRWILAIAMAGGMAVALSPLWAGWLPSRGNPWAAPLLVPVLAGALISLAALAGWIGDHASER